MSKESNRTAFRAKDLISEEVARRACGRRQRTRALTATNAVNGLPADPPTAADEPSPPAKRSATLRRWSVAELVAQAATRLPPPA